ncbi:hypothetical protein ARZXY2_4828 (plasmid) [Arthrobacter sp. ZXY-2]|nr:hypothetical protein ARZXY2_4828 [Arthrobacter sp. ZXY-2]
MGFSLLKTRFAVLVRLYRFENYLREQARGWLVLVIEPVFRGRASYYSDE